MYILDPYYAKYSHRDILHSFSQSNLNIYYKINTLTYIDAVYE